MHFHWLPGLMVWCCQESSKEQYKMRGFKSTWTTPSCSFCALCKTLVTFVSSFSNNGSKLLCFPSSLLHHHAHCHSIPYLLIPCTILHTYKHSARYHTWQCHIYTASWIHPVLSSAWSSYLSEMSPPYIASWWAAALSCSPICLISSLNPCYFPSHLSTAYIFFSPLLNGNHSKPNFLSLPSKLTRFEQI